MRLIHVFLTVGEFSGKLNNAKNFLAHSFTKLTINDKGAYCNLRGLEISNFFILPLSISPAYGSDGQKKDDIYQFELLNRNHCTRIIISSDELNSYKWLKAIGERFFLRKPLEDYRHLLAIFHAMWNSCQNNSPFFSETGFHHIENHWRYVTSNLTIHSDKLDWGQYMFHKQCHACKIDCSKCPYRLNSSFEKKAMVDVKKIQDAIIPIMTELNKNINVALPIFMMNLLSSLTSVFSSAGLCTPLILWITGEPGSGKTQLALYLGSFFNKPKTRNDAMLAKNFLRENISTKVISECLQNSRDNTVILDDVKSENSTSLGEHKNTNLDILIRSIFDHNLNGTPIYSGAIITGEFSPNVDSTLSRLILLPLKTFQDSPENLETLSFFQDNGYLLTDFIVLFLQWVCQQLEKKEFLPALQDEKSQYTKKYIEEGFSARNSEIQTTLKLGLDLLEDFSSTYTPPAFQKTIGLIVANGINCFRSLINNTSYLYGNSPRLYAEILSRMILHEKSIRCVPVITYAKEVDLFNFCFSSKEDGIFIENPAAIAEKSYFRDTAHNQPCLLVQKKILEEDLKFAVEDYCEAHNIPLQNTKKAL